MTLLAAAASTLGNVARWAVGHSVGRMTLGVTEVVLGSVIGAVAGGAFALCGRWAKRPVRMFRLLALAVVVLYAAGPVSAAYAPYMEGAELFNMDTLIVTELMHLVSAGCVVFLLTQRAVGTASGTPRENQQPATSVSRSS
jgi:hypothetical protein